MDKEERINRKFNEVLTSLTDNQFWTYVRTWFDENRILEEMQDWDTETKKQAIKEMENIKNGN